MSHGADAGASRAMGYVDMQERDLFLEELRNEFCQVDAPVFPDMTVG